MTAPSPPPPVDGERTTQAGWQPIETAPKDGTRIILLTHESAVFCGHWLNGDHELGWWYDPINDHEYIHTPVLGWMPLPAPPSSPPHSLLHRERS